MQPLVSIITPSFNQGKFIRRTIESVLSQDYPRIEYIIIDGGSTDNTEEIINEYRNSLIYISKKDDGQSDAINKGFKMAKGEIVGWLNSDDIYEPNCISKVVKEFVANDNIGLVYGEGYIIDENNEKVKKFEYTQDFDLWKLVNYSDYIMQPTTFFKASLLQKVDYLDVNLHYCMDWDLWIKLSNISEVKYINAILACSREYGDTKTRTGKKARLEEICNLLKKYSGDKNPIGIKSYTASSIYMNCAQNKLTEFIARKYLEMIHKRIDSSLPSLYADGWMGKRLEMLIPNFKQEIFIEINNALNRPNVIKLNIDNCIIKEFCLTSDTLFINFKLGKVNMFHKVCMFAENTYLIHNDKRRLSIKVNIRSI